MKSALVQVRKQIVCAIFLTMMLFLMVGCKKDDEPDYSETTIIINKNGNIEHTIVGDFDKDYYNREELKTMIEQEIAKYQSLTGESGKVKLKDFIIEADTVKVNINYSSYKDYKSINNEILFVGNLAQAIAEGIDTDIMMVSRSTNERVSLEDAMRNGEKLVVFSEPVRVGVYSKIECVSANVETIDDKQARMSSDSVGEAYIVIK